MEPVWLLAGVACALSVIVLMLPWLRTVPGLGSLPALPWQAGGGAVLVMAATAVAWLCFRQPDSAGKALSHDGAAQAAASGTAVDSWAGISNAFGHDTAAVSNTTGSSSRSAAEPMAAAIATLQARLAKGGGSAADWELLAKSYEFIGRAADASKVRAHQLPPLPSQPAVGPELTASGGNPSMFGTKLDPAVSQVAGSKSRPAAGANHDKVIE